MKDRIKSIQQGQKIANGIGREIYRIDNGMIAKIPKVYASTINTGKSYAHYRGESKRHVAQSIVELYVFNHCPLHLKHLLCPIVDAFYLQDIPILIMPEIKIMKTKVSLGKVMNKQIKELAKTCNLKEPEMSKKKNIGKYNGAYVVVDYGYLADKKTMENLPKEYLQKVGVI